MQYQWITQAASGSPVRLRFSSVSSGHSPKSVKVSGFPDLFPFCCIRDDACILLKLLPVSAE